MGARRTTGAGPPLGATQVMYFEDLAIGMSAAITRALAEGASAKLLKVLAFVADEMRPRPDAAA
jgi:hypothetical protein